MNDNELDMIDFPRDSDIADHPGNPDGVVAKGGIDAVVDSDNERDTSSTVSSDNTKDNMNRFVRGLVIDPTSKRILCMVNNRVSIGALTIMFPGGGVERNCSELSTLATQLNNDVGITAELSQTNTRFILSRTYEFKNDSGQNELARVNYYAITIDGVVPRNMLPESVISLSWLSLADIRRNLELDEPSWKIQLGGLDAIEAVLNPERNKIVGDMREVSRQDGGQSDELKTDVIGRPKPLSY